MVSVIILISQDLEMRFREVQALGQGHTVGKWQGWDPSYPACRSPACRMGLLVQALPSPRDDCCVWLGRLGLPPPLTPPSMGALGLPASFS